MKSFNLVLKAVLEKELYTTPPLMPVIVAKVVGTKKDIPRAFKIMNDLLSSADLKHLRRIKTLKNGDMECIICKLKSNQNHDEELKKIEEKFKDSNIFVDYRIAQVPSSAPKTIHQLKGCSDIWPCKFAKSNYLIQCIEGSVFSEPERIVLKIIVNSVLEHIRLQKNKSRSAAVVFRCAKIHGVGLTNSEVLCQNPIQHSTMVSIDSVATKAGAGHWKCPISDELHKNIQNKLDDQEELKDHRVDAHFLPYLCTNYDIFVTEEPCLMCTMGLVQSRIRRLFFLDYQSTKLANCRQLCYPDRAIEDFLVHREKNLNHRFEAWRITLVPEKDEDDDGVQQDKKDQKEEQPKGVVSNSE